MTDEMAESFMTVLTRIARALEEQTALQKEHIDRLAQHETMMLATNKVREERDIEMQKRIVERHEWERQDREAAAAREAKLAKELTAWRGRDEK